MDVRRIVKHLVMTRRRVKREFPEDTLAAIGSAVEESESTHGAEIRFAIEGALHPASLFRNQTARERALEVFSQLRVWDTEHNSGVLIYLLVADRAVEIVVDRGVNAVVDPNEWKQICGKMEEAFRQGRYREGAVAGIHAATQCLARHFRLLRQDELPNDPIILR
jgi:uncharacterized membrane protein